MKTKKTTVDQFTRIYSHPSAILFRAIEMKTIHRNLEGIEFSHPSMDLGCGDGKIAEMIFDQPFTYGVDNGEAKDVGDAVESGRYEKIFLESAEKMSLPNNSVNFVFSNCVIEHIPDNEAVLRETSRILNKGGAFIFTVPSHNFPDYLFLTSKFAAWGLGFLSRFYKYRRNKMLNQFHCYSAEDWQQKLAKHGLKMVKHEYYMTKGALMLWDKMALELFFKKILWPHYEKKALRKYLGTIRETAEKDIAAEGRGAGLFVYCVKE